jgi:hypothetical protein
MILADKTPTIENWLKRKNGPERLLQKSLEGYSIVISKLKSH